MASGMTNTALKEILNGTIDLDTDSLKVMLVDNDYVFDPDNPVVDKNDDSVQDAHHHELVATNYVGDFGGAGRKAATVTVDQNDTTNKGTVALASLTWTSLGGAANDTIGMALLIKEGTSDLDSRIIAAWDVTDTPTNGGNVTLNFGGSAPNITVG